MILKYIKHQTLLLNQLRYTFSQPQKKRSQAPKYTRSKPQNKIDPRNIDYSKIPEDVRKGVKAYVQATNVLVSSQAELQTMALRQVILEQREKFITTLEQLGSPPPKIEAPKDAEGAEKKAQEIYYDLMKAIKFTTTVSNALMAINLTGYGLLYTLKKYEYLGFLLGISINPSIISLTGLAIGFNAASWIIIQSLHLSIKDPKQLTPQTISLTNCSPLMYLEALSIASQTGALSYYLMQPHPFANISFLIGSFALSQLHLVYSVLRATSGFKFELFSKLLITQITVGLLIVSLVYSFFSKIEQNKHVAELTVSTGDIQNAEEGVLMAKGYQRFLEEFKEKKIAVVKGQTINQIINEEAK